MSESDTRFQVVVQDPPLLRALLLAAGNDPEMQAIITRAYHVSLEGSRFSPFVMNAVLLSAIGNALLRNANEGSADGNIRSSAGKTNGEVASQVLNELKADIAAARATLAQSAGAQDRSHQLMAASFEKLWRLVAEAEKKQPLPSRPGQRKRRWIAIGIVAGLVLVAPIIGYQYGLIVGQRAAIGHVARTLYDSAQLGPWISVHHGFLIFRPTQDPRGKPFHSIIVLIPGIQKSDAGVSEAGEAFINLPD